MRPLRYSINVTLDGCCDHRAISPDEDLHRHAAENLAQADAFLFGRVTYELMEAGWRPFARTKARPDWMQPWMEPFAHTIDAAKKYVVSRTLEWVDWNAELVRGDLGTAVVQLKQEPGKGLFVGGVQLPLALADLGLIDEYEFVVQPRLAGHGPTVFVGLSRHVDLTLVSRLEFASGGGGDAVCAEKLASGSEVDVLPSRLSFSWAVGSCLAASHDGAYPVAQLAEDRRLGQSVGGVGTILSIRVHTTVVIGAI